MAEKLLRKLNFNIEIWSWKVQYDKKNLTYGKLKSNKTNGEEMAEGVSWQCRYSHFTWLPSR